MGSMPPEKCAKVLAGLKLGRWVGRDRQVLRAWRVGGEGDIAGACRLQIWWQARKEVRTGGRCRNT